MLKNIFYKKFLREGVWVRNTQQFTPPYQQLAGTPRMSNLNPFASWSTLKLISQMLSLKHCVANLTRMQSNKLCIPLLRNAQFSFYYKLSD